MAAGNFGNRQWYHGTSKRAYHHITTSGFLLPHLADCEDYGKAIWFTSNLEEAKTFGRIILCISNNNASKFNNKKFSPYPHGYIKQCKLDPPTTYGLLIFERIPLKQLTISKL